MKLRNLNGAIRKADDRSVKIRINTPVGILTAGLTKAELMAGFAELGLDPTTETGMTVVKGFFQFEGGADVFGYAGLGPAIHDEETPTFDDDLLGDDDATAEADDDLLASDAPPAPADDVEDLLAL